MISCSPLMVCRAPQLLEGGGLIYLFIPYFGVTWTEIQKWGESVLIYIFYPHPTPRHCVWGSAVVNIGHFLPHVFDLTLRAACGVWWGSEGGRHVLPGARLSCTVAHGGIRAQVSHTLLCFPRGPALPGPWVRGLGSPQGGGRRRGIRAQTGSVLASWMWGLTSQKSLFSDASIEVFQSLI